MEVLSSASKSKLAGLYGNGKEAVPEHITLNELDHPQLPTPMVTNNSTASGIANNWVKQKRSKAMNMQFYWICNQVCQGQFIVYWRHGLTNCVNYFTKHHSGKHHHATRPVYIKDKPKPCAQNYYTLLSETPPGTIGNPSPTRGEGALIPSMPCAC
jgi:hypothetical protein